MSSTYSVAHAVKSNSHKILKLLLTVPGSVPQREAEWALFYAAEHGYIECLKLLISYGSCKDARNSRQSKPLHVAVENRRTECVVFLVSEKLGVNSKNTSGLTPLHIAAQKGFCDSTEALLAESAIDINCRDRSGNTPALLAARFSHLGVLKQLVVAGCSVNLVNYEGRTALHYAAHIAIGVDMLLSAGADPDIEDSTGNTPLVLACSEGLDGAVTSLVAAGCDVNKSNSSGTTALHLMAMKGHTSSVKLLIEAGAQLNLRDNANHTPLWYATQYNRLDSVREIMRHCHMKCLEIDPCVRTCLHNGNKVVLAVLVSVVTDVNLLKNILLSDDVEVHETIEEDQKFMHWLHDMSSVPRPLKHLARCAIRSMLIYAIDRKLKQLHRQLPPKIVEYICLSDIDAIGLKVPV